MSTSLDKLRQAMESASPAQGDKKTYGDDTFWKPELDKSGNGYAVVRFLPTPEGDEMPWVSYFDHGFQGLGGWYIEKSLTTIGKKDPVSEYNTSLWNTGIEANKEQARKQKRRLHYVSNILVVQDPSNPANNGKVFLYDFGKKIFDKIMDKMQPEFPGEEPVVPFDFWNGADFQLKIRNVAGYRNYDKSEFKAPSALYEADEVKLEATYNQMFDLGEFTAPKSFKPYDELKGRLEVVLGTAVGTNAVAATANISQTAEENVGRSAPEPEIVSSPAPAVGKEDDEDDTLSYFAKMAQED